MGQGEVVCAGKCELGCARVSCGVLGRVCSGKLGRVGTRVCWGEVAPN